MNAVESASAETLVVPVDVSIVIGVRVAWNNFEILKCAPAFWGDAV